MTFKKQSRGLGGVSGFISVLVSLSFLASVLTVASASAQQNPDPGQQRVVSWHGLLTKDAAAANAFYSGLFGWEIQRSSEGRYLVTHNGALIGGVTEIEESTTGEDESTWLLGISVPDVKASVAEARRLGARILVDVTNAQGIGDWAVIRDTQAAEVLVFSPERPLGDDGGDGSWVWAELWTEDIEASTQFYSSVVGWEGGTWERPDGPYPVFLSNGELSAGLVPLEDGGWRPGWAPYVGVADLLATLTRAVELGGQVLLEPDPDMDEGLVAAIADPTGVGFMVYQLPEKSP